MEVVWEEGEVRPKDEWMTPPVMELIRDAIMTARITCRPIEKIKLSKSEWVRLRRETDWAMRFVPNIDRKKSGQFMGVEIEVCND